MAYGMEDITENSKRIEHVRILREVILMNLFWCAKLLFLIPTSVQHGHLLASKMGRRCIALLHSEIEYQSSMQCSGLADLDVHDLSLSLSTLTQKFHLDHVDKEKQTGPRSQPREHLLANKQAYSSTATMNDGWLPRTHF